MEATSSKENDLPLMANIDLYHVQHYVLDLTCHIAKNILSGSVTLFVNQINSSSVVIKPSFKADDSISKKRKLCIENENINEKRQKKFQDILEHREINKPNESTDILDSNYVHCYEKSSSHAHHTHHTHHQQEKQLLNHNTLVKIESYLVDHSKTVSSSITPHCVTKSEEKTAGIQKLDFADNSHDNLPCLDKETSSKNASSNDINVQNIITSSYNKETSLGTISSKDICTQDIIPSYSKPQEIIVHVDPVSKHPVETVNSSTNSQPEKKKQTRLDQFEQDSICGGQQTRLDQSEQDGNCRRQQTVDQSEPDDSSRGQQKELHQSEQDDCSGGQQTGLDQSEPDDSGSKQTEVAIVLDACDIIVSEVLLLPLPFCIKCQNTCFKQCQTDLDIDSVKQRQEFYRECSLQTGKAISFKCDKWSLRMFVKELNVDGELHKMAIKVKYSTLPKGKSLKWVPDQDGNLCMITCGHWINNRSLFPSQDHPEALSTWQACVTVDDVYTVIMTGDTEPLKTNTENGKLCYFYQSTMLLPTSTLAIAIGQWPSSVITSSSEEHLQQKWVPEFCAAAHSYCSVNYCKTTLPCRVFAPRSLLSKAVSEFKPYLLKCFTKACHILGPYPFRRLDILIVPSSFSCLGLTSPCVMFVSQSVLVGDCSFCNCLAHELCHFWFGLLIGPKDWTEEWMTEGFACFVEDIVHTDLMGLDELFELRAYLKYKLLTSELDHTDTNLQIMRPNKTIQEDSKANSIINGMNPEKRGLQVHYLKGYFLLRHLSQIVGIDKFQDFLRLYVTRYHGQLVSSQDFLKLFFEIFPHLSQQGLTPTQICEEWLDEAGLPLPLQDYKQPSDLSLVTDVTYQVHQIEKQQQCHQKKNLPTLEDARNIFKFTPKCQDQTVLLLELLLDVAVSKNILQILREKLDICHCNPDVQHRWCELVIKNKFTKFYGDIKNFLLQHQAMGSYLYGEMILSGSRKQITMAKECFKLLLPNLEEDSKETLRSIIFG
ncbi:hypothetical protein Ahia01_000396600 [Argonauta hians]